MLGAAAHTTDTTLLSPTMKLLGVSVLATAALAAPMTPIMARGAAGQVCDNPGRVVSIVLDSSGSTKSSDPNRLRIQGGIDLLDYLTSQSEATATNKADTVSVVDFDLKATVDYAQGDPNQAARDALQAIDSDGGTAIPIGIEAGLNEILKNNPGNRGGMILFTDGQDPNVDGIVGQINRAKAAGVRISIGHSGSDKEEPVANGSSGGISWLVNEVAGWLTNHPKTVVHNGLDKRISQAALNSGGTVAIITSPDALRNFVHQVIKNGITNNDGKCSGNDIGESGGPLIKDVSSLGLCSKNAEAVFTYSPTTQSEELTFDVTLLSKESTVSIDATFTNKATGQTSSVSVNKGNLIGQLSGNAVAGQQVEVRIRTSNANSNECQYSVKLLTKGSGGPAPSSEAPPPSSSAAPIPSSSAAPEPSSSAIPEPSSSAAPEPSSAVPIPSSSVSPSPAPTSSECPAPPAASTVTTTTATTVTITGAAPSATVCICKCDAPGAKPLPKFEL